MKHRLFAFLLAACFSALFLFSACGANENDYTYGAFSGTEQVSFHTDEDKPADAVRFRTSVGGGTVIYTLLNAAGDELDSYTLSQGRQEIGFDLPDPAGSSYTLRWHSNLAINLKIELYCKGLLFDPTKSSESPSTPNDISLQVPISPKSE